MRNRWKLSMAVPLACASLLIGCGNADEPAANMRPAQDAREGPQQVALEGCVEAAPGTNQYVLRHIRVAPMAEQPSDALSSDTGITEGAWVKLQASDEEQLRSHVGQHVSVIGRIVDDGRDTIGTSGATYGPEDGEPRTDRSRASANEHHSDRVRQEAGPIAQQSLANGVAPEIAVQRVSGTGRACDDPAKLGDKQ